MLTGDRPTGKLHIGHLVGSLQKRVALQDSCESYIMIADAQAITDNVGRISRVTNSIFEIACDYFAVGIDPAKSNVFIQSMMPALPELAMYYLNFVSIDRIGQNPTVKAEIGSRQFKDMVPAGFYLYPLYQVADITAFKANLVPVGKDQLPMLELSRDIVRKFNATFDSDVLVEPIPISSGKILPGIDGAKMSKSYNNAIYLSDEDDVILDKINKMKSDPNRASAQSPGNPDDAIAFSYLSAVDNTEGSFIKKLKDQYCEGSISDKELKKIVADALIPFIGNIRRRRIKIAKDPAMVYEAIKNGNEAARRKSDATLQELKEVIGINYQL